MTERQPPLILAVFAGGPHTAPRVELAESLMEETAPDAIYLTGYEFAAHKSHLAERLRSRAQGSRLFVDPSMTTWASCRFLAADIPQRFQGPVRLIAVTSNYHRPRLRWLLSAVLPRTYDLDIHASTDLRFTDLSRLPMARKLIWGEFLSWSYCLPLGLLVRLKRTRIQV